MTTTDPLVNPTGLELAIASLLDTMSNVESDSDEYKAMVDQLVKLYNLKKIDNELHLKTLEENRLAKVASDEIYLKDREVKLKENETDANIALTELEIEERKKELGRRFKVTHDTLAIVAGNLLGIAIVVGYERAHVLTSKAFANLLKPR